MAEAQGLGEKVAVARRRKGLTQEKLADSAGVTVRTVQRTESGDSVPRPFTLKAIATALEIPFEDLVPAEPEAAAVPGPMTAAPDEEGMRHFLQVFCLSCFSFIVVPYVHFLIPARLLRKQTSLPTAALSFARRTIRGQLYWMVSFHVSLLLTLVWNYGQAKGLGGRYPLSYFAIVALFYGLNGALIGRQLYRAARLPLTT